MTDGHLEDHVGELGILCVMLKGLSLITKTIYYEKHFQILALPLMVSFGDNSVLGGLNFHISFFEDENNNINPFKVFFWRVE